MPKCSFCSENYEFPRGLTLVLPDGRILYFCSSKCRKNYKLGRIGKKMKWVSKKKKQKQEQESGKEIAKTEVKARAREEKEEKPETEKVEEKIEKAEEKAE